MGDNIFLKNIIFDLDGTLIDSINDISLCLIEAYNSILGIKRISLCKEDIGPPLYYVVKKISPWLEEERINEVIEHFRYCYDNSNYGKTILYEGVKELLINLSNSGYKLFLATNKPVLPTRKIIKKLEIEYFDDIITSNSIEGKNLNKTEMISYLLHKWSMNKDRTIMVGDSISDINAAHDNNIIAIAVLNGYGNIDITSKPEYKIEQVSDLTSIVYKGGNDE